MVRRDRREAVPSKTPSQQGTISSYHQVSFTRKSVVSSNKWNYLNIIHNYLLFINIFYIFLNIKQRAFYIAQSHSLRYINLISTLLTFSSNFPIKISCAWFSHGNLRYPPKATPPRNKALVTLVGSKALLRETNG